MRALGFAVLIAFSSLGFAQVPLREGSYAPKGEKAVAWRIDENHSLVWDGKRYVPVGVRVDGTAAAVDAANEAGIKDLLIDLPVAGDWGATISEAEKNGQRYLVRISSHAPGTPGMAVDPAAYRIGGLVGSRHFEVPLYGATEALVIVALQRDGSLLDRMLLPVKDGRISIDTKVNAGLDNVVLIYPRTDSLETPDLWTGFDGHRDALLARLGQTPFGKGLRGIVDPMGRSASLPGQELHGVPTTVAFQAELATVLEANYRTIDNVMKGWSMGASTLSTSLRGNDGKTVVQTTFMDLAKLVPLWSGGRGVFMLWDPTTNRVYPCSRDSQVWKDISQAISSAASRRIGRLCAAIRSVVNVPVVQEWNGWSGLTEAKEPAFDGIAARASGASPSELVDSAARTVSTAVRWSTRGWLVATDVAVAKKDLRPSLDDLAALGLRAAFVDADPKDVSDAAKDRGSNPPADLAINPVFFPENAANPAAAQRLPNGRWWLPTPEDGNRLDYGDSFYGYRMRTPQGDRVVIWAKSPGRYLLRMVHPETARITSMDGSDSDPRKAKNGLLLTIGQFPVLIDELQELPVPDIAFKETLDTFLRLTQLAESTRHVGTDETYAFTEAAAVFDQNPGGSYTVMRQQLRSFAGKLSPLAWIEAESTRDTTFSDVAPLPGASGARALVLRVAIPSEDGYVANYAAAVRERQPVELWIAARLTPERRRELEVAIGGVTLFANDPPVSSYGAGFAWYHLGTTRFSSDKTNVSLRMRAGVGAEAAIDVIVFAPPGWRPNGLSYPYNLVPSPLIPSPKRPG